jgi:hypothetical protein
MSYKTSYTSYGPGSDQNIQALNNVEIRDEVNHPYHYADTVPGIECIEVTQHFSFCRGNAIKYLWRAGAKGNTVQDLQKAIWYIQWEIDSLCSTRESK